MTFFLPDGDVKQESTDNDKRPPVPKYSSNKFCNVLHVDFPVTTDTMSHVLSFIYGGELTADIESVGDVLDAAIKLKILQLERRCIIELRQKYDK